MSDPNKKVLELNFIFQSASLPKELGPYSFFIMTFIVMNSVTIDVLLFE